MTTSVTVRVATARGPRDLRGRLRATGGDAARSFSRARGDEGLHLLLRGDRDYHVAVVPAPDEAMCSACRDALGSRVQVRFRGRSPVNRVLDAIGGLAASGLPVEGKTGGSLVGGPGLLDLNAGLPGVPPLYLAPDGRFTRAGGRAERDDELHDTIVAAARWASARRTSTFERLFPPSAFHPEETARRERLSPSQADGLLAWLRAALADHKVEGGAAPEAELVSAEVRSGCLTLLSHLLGTVLRDPDFAVPSAAAAREVFALIDAEQGPASRPELRAHAIRLLQLRAPALAEPERQRARDLLATLVRPAPPYSALAGPWRFAACMAPEFLEGCLGILVDRHGFRTVTAPADPAAPRADYRVVEAPFRTPSGEAIQVWARPAAPRDENQEMGSPFFVGLFINRHAQLGSFDMLATHLAVRQEGYKVMMNAQCAGLTTRFALSRAFPDADILSSWDSTYFRTDPAGRVVASEGVDCFLEVLRGMAAGETHAQMALRIQKAQWRHEASGVPGFVQFVGPAHPLFVARFQDVNQDGRADCYDGYLDFRIADIAEDVQASMTPRDPGVACTRVGGAAARGLSWAAGSLDRVTQYSDVWSGLRGQMENLYAYQAGGFYSHREPAHDVPLARPGSAEPPDPARLPALCRYVDDRDVPSGVQVDVLFHSWLAHSGSEMKRLLCAAEAFWTALDLGYIRADGPLGKPVGQRAAVLLTLAGLLEFPGDPNWLDGLWVLALQALNLPGISRTVVRRCITELDHGASNYYGSRRGILQLVGDGRSQGDLGNADPVAWARLASDDPSIGRAAELGGLP